MLFMALARPDLKNPWHISLIQQIVDHVTGAVASGELRPGEKLPAGRDLAADWEVGYSTVTEAMKRLVEKGVLVTGQGKGTFVAERHPD